MIGTESNSCKIVEKSLRGERKVDEQTFTSLAILTERLERLRDLGGAFAKVEFSSAVKGLAREKSKVAVC
jgi:hypothetical protein